VIESYRNAVQVIIEEVAVGVQGLLRGTVSKHPLQRFHVGTSRYGEARASVPQFVRSQAQDAYAGGRVIEPAASEGSVAQYRAGLGADEHVFVATLARDVLGQLIEDELGNGARPLPRVRRPACV